MAKRKHKTPFVEFVDASGLWITPRDAGIDMLYLLIDGIPMRVTTGKRGKAYISVEVAAEWHEKESTTCGDKYGRKKHHDTCASALRIAAEKFRLGKVEVVDETVDN